MWGRLQQQAELDLQVKESEAVVGVRVKWQGYTQLRYGVQC
jgi:hypothetical protein